MTTETRLRQYKAFDDDIIERVADVAAEQNTHSFAELADRYSVADGPESIRAQHYGSRRFELLHFKPKGDYDETRARILAPPLALPVDPSLTMRALRLFAADPSEQLFVLGAPTHVGNRSNLPDPCDVTGIWRGDFSPLAMPLIMHLKGHRQRKAINSIDTLGFSYGADLAVGLSETAASYGIETQRNVWAEPAGARVRELRKIKADTQVLAQYRTHFDRYVRDADSRPLNEALEESKVSPLRYAAGLARLSNLAILRAISRGEFADRAERALRVNPDSRATIAWGSASEFVEDATMESIVQGLGKATAMRTGKLVLESMHHAGANDIDLHAALMLQGLRNATAE